MDVAALVQQSSERLERELRDELARSSAAAHQLLAGLGQFQQGLTAQGFAAREAQDQALVRLTDAIREQLREMQQRVDLRLGQIQEDTEKKLEQMRATVDENSTPRWSSASENFNRWPTAWSRYAQGPWRDAEPGARRRLAQPRAHQCQDARHFW